MNKTWIRILAALSLTLVSLAWLRPTPGQANGNNLLAPAVSLTVRGDVTAAGAGMRGTGTGIITVTGVPGGAAVERAWLYWATLGNVNTYTSPTLNGQPVDGDLIGTSGDTCWGVQHNFVYRAEVTDLVTGNGAYTVAGLPADLGRGNDTQGASLVVAYTSSNLPLRTILINDGAVSLDLEKHSYTNNITGFIPDSPVTNASVTYLVGDGQAMWDAGNVSFNGQPIASNIFSGVDGDFWGTHTFDVTNLVTPGQATTTINNNDPNNSESPDCLLWAATIFTVTTQQPVESTNQLSPFRTVTLTGDVTASGVGLRGSGSGDIQVSGIPTDGRVFQAYLYWATLGNSAQFRSPSLQGQAVAGELIGASGDTCWGVLGNYVYRANVTDIVKGNGSYALTGLPDNLAAGNDTQGASLVIIYSQPGLFKTILINDGAVTLDLVNHTYTDTFTGFTADQPNAQAYITYLVGDGQERWSSGSVTFEGTPIANNVFTGIDGPQWGTLTMEVTGLVTEPTSTTVINNDDPADPGSPDCLLWAATILSVETEPPVLQNPRFLPMLSWLE